MSQSLTSLDIATGTMLGCERRPAPLPDDGLAPRAVMEQAILEALVRPPCLVSFSGGRDSSAVLAVATALARREGLDLPIPATNCFPNAPNSQESEWQLRIVRHLGLQDWIRVEHDNELDIVGPYAQRVLRKHGLVLPCNVHFHLPLLDLAAGGSMLTGVGGDELFAAARARPAIHQTKPRRAIPRRLAAHLLELTPPMVRDLVGRRRHPISLPWLYPDGCRQLTARVAEVAAREPRGMQARLAWWRGLRYLGDGTTGLNLIAADVGARITHPLLLPALWAAVGRVAPRGGFAGRTEGMTALFGDLLPPDVLDRRTKAEFDQAMWTGTARRFAAGWDGAGAPRSLVDADALRRTWSQAQPPAASFTLLQAAWLAGTRAGTRHLGDGAEQGRDGILV